MKRPIFEHVSLRTETRSDNGESSHVLTWYPVEGKRKRKTFSDEGDAIAEATRLDNLLGTGYEAATKMSTKKHGLFIILCDQHDLDPLEVVQFWIAGHTANGILPTAATIHSLGEEFKNSRSSKDDFSDRQISSVRQHINRFVQYCSSKGVEDLKKVGPDFISHTDSKGEKKGYLNEEVGGVGKTRMQHLITLKSWFRWARDKRKVLPYGVPTAPEQVTPPKVVKTEHEVYAPEQFMRLLIFTPTVMVKFMVLGQLAGIRAEERTRMYNHHWRKDEDNKLVLDADVTKTDRRRRVDVEPNLAEWLDAFNGDPNEKMVPCSRPYRMTPAIAEAAGLPWLDNALRAGYASYHLELFDNAALTAKNDGHSVQELESTYKSISGVTKKKAREIFAITPKSVLEYAQQHGLPTPEWAGLVRPG